jgi:hypothetical protein
MHFRTEIQVAPSPFNLTHKDDIFLMGSCFTENIGVKLEHFGFNPFSNPYGITFNPLSLAQQLQEILRQKQYSEDELLSFKNQHLSLQHHSSFNHTIVDEILNNINENIEKAHHKLKSAKVLFLSLGSSWVWRYNTSGKLVNNCHKIPTSEFTKEILSADEITQAFDEVLAEIKDFNTNLKVVFTVSPVRHWRHGATENSRSKAILLNAVHRLNDNFSFLDYFPSYEIMMDDLRDYRFYTDDMLHPSAKAIEYIWQKFGDAFFTPKTQEANKLVDKVRSMETHRFMSNNKLEQQKFNTKLEQRKAELSSKYGISL